MVGLSGVSKPVECRFKTKNVESVGLLFYNGSLLQGSSQPRINTRYQKEMEKKVPK